MHVVRECAYAYRVPSDLPTPVTLSPNPTSFPLPRHSRSAIDPPPRRRPSSRTQYKSFTIFQEPSSIISAAAAAFSTHPSTKTRVRRPEVSNPFPGPSAALPAPFRPPSCRTPGKCLFAAAHVRVRERAPYIMDGRYINRVQSCL